MSLHFNWGRLDETCAEALRQLINKRLTEVVARINRRRPASHPPDPAASPAPPASSPPAAAPAPPLLPQFAAAPAAASATTLAPSAHAAAASGHTVPGKPEFSPNGSSSGGGSPHEPAAGSVSVPPAAAGTASGGGGGATGAGGPRWETASDPSCSSTFPSVAGVHGSGVVNVPTHSGGAAASSATGPVAAGPTASGGGAGTGVSDLLLTAEAGGHATPAGGGGGAVSSETASFASDPTPVPATAAYRAAANASPSMTGTSSPLYAPASPTIAISSAAGVGGGAGLGNGTPLQPPGPAASAPAQEPRDGVPPIVYLEVGRIEWGTTPPFVEIVAFENAVDGPPGRTRQQQQQYGGRGLFGGPATDTRGTSPFTVSHATSMDTMMTASATAAEHGGALLRPSGGGGHADNVSEGSHGLASRAQTAASTPHIVGGSHSHFDAAGASVCGPGPGGAAGAAAAAFPPQPAMSPEPADPLVSMLGPGGLYVRLHMTYGGALHLSLNIAVQHELRLGAVALRVSLPMMFYLANLDLDCYVCVNLRHGACEVWLEPGPLSSSVVNRLSLTATIGGDAEEDGSDSEGGHKTGDYGTSSADFYSRFGSSSLSEDEGGEDGSGVYVNEHEVSQFVLHELRAILRETLVAPHSIRVPVSFGASAS